MRLSAHPPALCCELAGPSVLGGLTSSSDFTSLSSPPFARLAISQGPAASPASIAAAGPFDNLDAVGANAYVAAQPPAVGVRLLRQEAVAPVLGGGELVVLAREVGNPDGHQPPIASVVLADLALRVVVGGDDARLLATGVRVVLPVRLRRVADDGDVRADVGVKLAGVAGERLQLELQRVRDLVAVAVEVAVAGEADDEVLRDGLAREDDAEVDLRVDLQVVTGRRHAVRVL